MILASKSPRRKEILENVGFELKIIGSDIDEKSDEKENIEKIKDIAYQKTYFIAKEHKDEYVVGADTIVELDGEIIGKPKSRENAVEILKRLSGKNHNVITGFCLININKGILIKDFGITKVFFKDLDDSMIEWYVDSGQPMDKAGAYGIQDKGSVFIEKIEGDFFTVMGFPIEKFVAHLKKLGIELKDIDKI
ncbi:dTTP/UTP pyrophosphatase [Fusobacterium sp. DD29]|uniref:Maf family protein n=1 Tax=unclassified Fusobacterium TaxID=2648384 RepID=UPI001B8CAEA3|nr:MULTISPECIES: nucleoside triphosphate pyrophosphatase [unclassified Fusobacterium]MBR8701722.1 dTTP/UTP pyrophosphatase [Fusobacterium sp. DD45]MBR8711492.1 dTTP/UTP pyrophosphatase [Fusobacterium sp. DD28]MBR8749828.1 dTTP/UTP pyrophosphatase [Fusobacterium sp. DD29]MBR8752041.1 dTTP/UTP pyrophosphatase [Fusobacterium sp. DD26]MBR8762070.1 dTTP/UTP pyrophosphatase [Fusobacterium sp. DD25]